MSSHCEICLGAGNKEESCFCKPSKNSNKTLKEVTDFLDSKIEESLEAERWSDGSAFSLIKQFIDNNSPALTAEELKLLKTNITNQPVKKSNIEEEDEE